MSTLDQSADGELFRKAARSNWCSEELQIDEGAPVSSSEKGVWVSAWVWVDNFDAGIEDDDEDREHE